MLTVTAASAITPPSPSPTAMDAARSEVTRQFEAARLDLVKRCWEPLATKRPDPTTTNFTLHVLFDANGEQLGRSFLEKGGTIRGGVAQCVGLTLPQLRVPPLGARLTLEIPLSLP
jgi:hypothetical protein